MSQDIDQLWWATSPATDDKRKPGNIFKEPYKAQWVLANEESKGWDELRYDLSYRILIKTLKELGLELDQQTLIDHWVDCRNKKREKKKRLTGQRCKSRSKDKKMWCFTITKNDFDHHFDRTFGCEETRGLRIPDECYEQERWTGEEDYVYYAYSLEKAAELYRYLKMVHTPSLIRPSIHNGSSSIHNG